MKFEDKENPGTLVLLKCIDVIKVFAGKNSTFLLNEDIFYNKKLYKKLRTTQIYEIQQTYNRLVEASKCYNPEVPIVIGISNIQNLGTILKSIVNSIYYDNLRNKNLRQLLINLLVPPSERFEINEYNEKSIINCYRRMFFGLIADEAVAKFTEFILQENNYKLFKSCNSQLITKIKDDVIKALNAKYNDTEFSVYEMKKAVLFLSNYEKLLKKWKILD